jgi:L-alanine-DL-glutamate epimerase-like enolase superfamily enzyme
VTLSLTQEFLHLSLRDPFRIARTDHHTGAGVTTVIVELRDDAYPGLVGVGEGYPDRFYGETPETIAAVLPTLLGLAEGFSDELATLEDARRELQRLGDIWAAHLRRNGAAKCAIDIAVHDFAGKALGIPVHDLLGLPAAIPATDFTIGIDEPSIVAERAARAAHFPAL